MTTTKIKAYKWKQYFNFSNSDDDRLQGYCTLCKKYYKDNKGIYSNFLKHLQRRHKKEYKSSNNHEDDSSGDNSEENNNALTTSSSSNKAKQNRINMSIAKNLIIKSNLPLNLVENCAFRDFMQECNVKWQPISSKRLKIEYISYFDEKVNKALHERLNDVKHVTITVDGWSDRKCRSFLGLTCHFVDVEHVPQNYLIDFVRIKSPHTGDKIHSITEEILDRYNLKDKVYKIVTDNASNMIKAYKFGLSADDEIVNNNEKIQSEYQGKEASVDIDEDIDLNELEFMDIQLGNTFEDDENLVDLRLSCFVHTIQLCVRDGLRNCTYISKLLSKCKKISKLSHKSSKIADALDDLNKNLHRMNVTRWNSDYLMIKSILNIGKKDLELIAALVENSTHFSNNDFTTLAEIVDILEPFFEISVKCQADQAVTASLIVPSVVHLIVTLDDMKDKLLFGKKLVQQLEESVKRRFSGVLDRLNLLNIIDYSNFGDPLYFVATVLDPSFRFYWIKDLRLTAPTENQLKQNIIALITAEISKNFQSHVQLMVNDNTTVSLNDSSRPKRRKLFDYGNQMNYVNQTTALDPAVELDTYLNDPLRTKFSDYWSSSQLHILKNLVVKIFSVQASSAPIERVFSSAGFILSSRRTRMNEQLFRNLVFLRTNKVLL